MKYTFLALLLIVFFTGATAQETTEDTEKFLPNVVALDVSHAFISQGINEDGKKYSIEPAWGVAYSRYLNTKWFLSLSIHLILEDFEVEPLRNNEESEVLERKKPVAPAISAGIKATRHSSFSLGFGGEFSSGEAFFLTRFTYEWSTEINEKWELSIPLTYDMRWNAYDVWDIGIGVARRF